MSSKRALLLIAAEAAQAEVVDVIGAAVLAANDVINLVKQHGRLLGRRAILARTSGALPHELASLVRPDSPGDAYRQKPLRLQARQAGVSLSRTSSEYSADLPALSVPSALFRASSSTRGTTSSRTASSAVSSRSRGASAQRFPHRIREEHATRCTSEQERARPNGGSEARCHLNVPGQRSHGHPTSDW